MNKIEILQELPRLSATDRREIALAAWSLDADAEILRECDQRADERFLVLDRMELQDAPAKSR
jgi:hypothetical protein